jgi:hypothetical protein
MIGFCQAVRATWALDGTDIAAISRSALSAGAMITAAAPTAAITPATSGARNVSGIVLFLYFLRTFCGKSGPRRGIDAGTKAGRYLTPPTPGMGEITRFILPHR